MAKHQNKIIDPYYRKIGNSWRVALSYILKNVTMIYCPGFQIHYPGILLSHGQVPNPAIVSSAINKIATVTHDGYFKIIYWTVKKKLTDIGFGFLGSDKYRFWIFGSSVILDRLILYQSTSDANIILTATQDKSRCTRF